MEIKRGDIVWVDFNPARGSEQAGFRPALVIQNDTGNKYAPTTIVAAITRTRASYPFMVPLEKGEGGLVEPSAVNLSQILTIDKSRITSKLGALSPEKMVFIDQAICLSLGLSI